MDPCPDGITDPHIRLSWDALTPEIKAIIISGVNANHRRSASAAAGAAAQALIQTGLPPPQGHPYAEPLESEERGRHR